jgi:hypothetical protein
MFSLSVVSESELVDVGVIVGEVGRLEKLSDIPF